MVEEHQSVTCVDIDVESEKVRYHEERCIRKEQLEASRLTIELERKQAYAAASMLAINVEISGPKTEHKSVLRLLKKTQQESAAAVER